MIALMKDQVQNLKKRGIKALAIYSGMSRQSPSLASAGTWKVMDFPPPVGISPKVSRPSVMPVSYTHLDVYKRQLMMFNVLMC